MVKAFKFVVQGKQTKKSSGLEAGIAIDKDRKAVEKMFSKKRKTIISLRELK